MADWYPTANKTFLGNNSGSFSPGYWKKGVLHTTEGSTAAGAISAYRSHNSWPHFTVETDGRVYQHIPLSKAARALENRSGGVETNRGGAIQIEVVGFASKPGWPPAQVNALRSLMRWIEGETGIRPEGPAFGGPNQYGLGNLFEFSNNQWITFKGWCGHQHVPENLHWDPGAIDLNTLLPAPVNPVPIPIYIGPEEPVQRRAIGPFKLDDAGNGWIGLPDIPFDKYRNTHVRGSFPPADGYWTIPQVAVQQREGIVIEITDGDPQQELVLYVDYI